MRRLWTLRPRRIRRVRFLRPLVRASYHLNLVRFLFKRRGDFDIVHVHLAGWHADLAALLTRASRTPLYVKVASGGVDGEVHRRRRAARITRWVGLRQADRVQALSSEILEEVVTTGVLRSRIARIPNGIDLARYRPVSSEERRALRENLGLPLTAVIVLYAGRFTRLKGFHDVLAAWDPSVPNGHLVLVGARSQKEMVSTPKGVTLSPWTDDVRPYLGAADVFVAPSACDGMSNAVLEAMAYGLPIITGRHGGTLDFLTEQDALLVSPGNVEGLREAIGRTVTDARLRRDLGSRSLSRVSSLSIMSVVDLIESEYRSMLQRSTAQETSL